MNYSNESKKLATRLAAIVKNVVPELVKESEGNKFEIVISDDGEGVGVSVEVELNEIEEAKDAQAIDQILKLNLQAALNKNKGDIKKAAAMCGMSVSGFKAHMKRIGVEQ